MSHSHDIAVDTPGIGHDDPEPQATWFIGLAGAVLLTALVLAVSVLFYGTQAKLSDEVFVTVPSQQREQLKAAQLEKLAQFGRYETTDAEGKAIERTRIPVSAAIDLILKDGTLTPPRR